MGFGLAFASYPVGALRERGCGGSFSALFRAASMAGFAGFLLAAVDVWGSFPSLAWSALGGEFLRGWGRSGYHGGSLPHFVPLLLVWAA